MTLQQGFSSSSDRRRLPDNPAVCEMMCQQNRRAVDILKDRGYRADYLELSGENHQSCVTAAMPAILRFVSGV